MSTARSAAAATRARCSRGCRRGPAGRLRQGPGCRRCRDARRRRASTTRVFASHTPASPRCASELAALGIERVHGVLLDLGVSSPQIDDPARGFSFRFDGSAGHAHGHRPAAKAPRISWPAPTSARSHEVIRDYGEERFAVPIAKALVARRQGGDPFEPPASWPRSWLARSRPASRARTLQRAHFRLFGFSSTPSLRSSNRA